MISLRYVAKNIILSIPFLFFPQLSYLVCNQSNQIWLNYFMDGCHFDYITKPPKSNTGWWWLQGHFSPAPFSSMLLIGFTGPSSLLNRLFFSGFITWAKEGDPYVQKKLVQNHSRKGRSTPHDAIPYNLVLQEILDLDAIPYNLVLQEIWDLSFAPSSSTTPPNTYQNCVPLCVLYLVYNSFSPPYLLAFQVTI